MYGLWGIGETLTFAVGSTQRTGDVCAWAAFVACLRFLEHCLPALSSKRLAWGFLKKHVFLGLCVFVLEDFRSGIRVARCPRTPPNEMRSHVA